MAYNKERVMEREVQDPHELRELVNQWPVVWVDVVGLGSEATLRAIADIFHIHPLALEDIVHVHQRAKVDPFDQNLYCVMRISGSDQRTNLGAIQPGARQELPGHLPGAAGRLL